ncbi:TPA: PTS sugar transporter subunit IIB [Salmonella enterica]|nr:PTS sugar transporter subunit IIB [Salmonella enterica]
MSIVLARIDNRLLHGIVASQWSPVTEAVRLMIINDNAANNEIIKNSMKLAKPVGMALSIISEETALANFQQNKYGEQTIFLVVDDPAILVNLAKHNVALPKVNIGGTVSRNNQYVLSSRASATEEEYQCYRYLADHGSNVFIQYMLADRAVDFNTVK